MCFGGGTSTSGTQFGTQNYSGTSTTTPDLNAYNYLLAGLQMGSNVAGIPYQPYTGQLVAGLTQDQLAALQGVREAQGYSQPYMEQAAQLTAQGYNLAAPSNFSQAAVGQYSNPLMNDIIRNAPTAYSQAAVSQYYDPRVQEYLQTAPMTYSPEAVQQYYNPYQQSVIDATKAQIEQQNAQQMAAQQAQAIQQGAFGGDRSGAARALLAGQQSLAENQTLGGLRQQGYQQALSAFERQQAQALAAATQQQQQAQSMFGAQQALGVQARQQQYAQALAQYNQQQQQAIAAAQKAAADIAQLGTQGYQNKMQELQALLASGQLQQQQQQQQLNQNYSQWLAAQAYPYAQLQAYGSAAGLAPGLGSTTNTSGTSTGYGTSTQQQSGGSPLSQIFGFGTSLLGAGLRFSDERAKTNVDYVGKDPKTGDPLYAYDYKSDVLRSEETGKPMPPKRVSPMAQDVAERRPEDVVDLGGLLGVKLGRAEGGEASSQDYLEEWKKPIFGSKSSVLGTTKKLEIPKLEMKHSEPKEMDLGFVPGPPKVPGGPMKLEGGSGGEGGGSLSGLGKVAGQAISKLSKGKSLGSLVPEALSSEKTSKEDLGSPLLPGTSETPSLTGEKTSSLEDEEFGSLLASNGGRQERATGGISTGSDIGSLINYSGRPTTTFSPEGFIGQAAFRNPVNTGVSVRQAFGPRGLGRDIPSSLAEFKLPWSVVNTGSPTYNKLLLQASKQVGPRQLTPQEFGLPAINTDYSNLSKSAAGTTRGPSNYIYQLTNMLTPEGTYFQVPVSSYTSPQFYVNPFEKTAPAYKSHGGPVREHRADGGRGFDLSSLGIMDPNPGDPEQPYILNEDMYPRDSSEGTFADLPLTAMSMPETNKITEVEDGKSPSVTTTAVSRPSPHKKIISQKSIGVKATPAKEGGFDIGELLSSLFGGKEEAVASDRHLGFKGEKPFGYDDTGYLQGFDLKDLTDALGLSTGGRAGYALDGGVEDGGDASSDDFMDRLKAAIAARETGGRKDPYSVIGPRSRKGDLPYGKYQVMGANVPSWTEEAGLGRLTPAEFLSSKEAQEAVAAHKLGEYYRKSGSPEKAAAMWFGGPGYASHMGARDVLGTSIPQYMADVRRNLGGLKSEDVVGLAQPRGVVASDRDTSEVPEKGLISLASDRGDSEGGNTLGNLFGLSPSKADELGAYLMATGAGMAASRNKSPFAAFGEGSLLGLEAMETARKGRESDVYKRLQEQNLETQILERNLRLKQIQDAARARQEVLGGAGGAGAPPATSSDTAPGAPGVNMPEAPETPTIAPGMAKPAVTAEPTTSAVPAGEVVTADPYDAEISSLAEQERKSRAIAQGFMDRGFADQAKPFQEEADKARTRRETVMENKRKSLSEKVEETSPMGIYRQGQNAAMGAADTLGNLKEIEQIINDPKVDFGVLSPYITAAKSATKQGQDYLPVLKSILPEVDTKALGRYERLSSEGNKLVLAATNGKLGAGISNADVSFLKDTVFNPARTREYNMDVLRKQEALQKKVLASAEEQERYKQSHGGIDSNFQSHMSQWGIDHPIQSFMRKEAEHKAGQIGSEKPVAADRKIVKRGTSGGRPVVQYEDGTIEYAD